MILRVLTYDFLCRLAIQMGVDGVCTDDPAVFLEWVYCPTLICAWSYTYRSDLQSLSKLQGKVTNCQGTDITSKDDFDVECLFLPANMRLCDEKTVSTSDKKRQVGTPKVLYTRLRWYGILYIWFYSLFYCSVGISCRVIGVFIIAF